MIRASDKEKKTTWDQLLENLKDTSSTFVFLGIIAKACNYIK